MSILCRSLIVLLILSGSLLPHKASAQLTIQAPGTNQRVKACEDLATTMYQDPWDMNQANDINNFLPGDVAAMDSISFLNGIFSFRTTAAQQSTFYLFSPQIRGSTRVGGRWGQDLAIDASVASKYRLLSLRMRSPSHIRDGGPRVIFNRSVDYVPNRTITHRQTSVPGWYVYRLDLPTLPISLTESSNTLPWSSGSITSLAIMPSSAANQSIDLDYIRLEDPSSCATSEIQFSTPSAQGNRYVNLYLDDNSDIADGYAKKLVTAAAAGISASTSTVLDGLSPGKTYRVTGFVDGDYANLYRDNQWDMQDEFDLLTASGLTQISFAGGALNAVTTNSEPTIYLDVPDEGIPASRFAYLSFRLAKTGSSPVQVFFANSSNVIAGQTLLDPDNDGVYQLNLAALPAWQGAISALIIRPAQSAGESISLDFVSLRSDAFVAALSAPVISSSPGSLTLNNTPVVTVQRPSEQGGESFQAWNMSPGDVALQTNLRTDADPTHQEEPYTAFLPDVRVVDGVRGDFFKGTNILGNDDPAIYLTFPYSKNPSLIDSSRFRNLCTRLLVDHELDVCLGSIVKPVWLNQDHTFTDTVAAVGIYNRWSGSKWLEYCFDLTTLSPLEGSGPSWGGTIHGLRIDPHEFSRDTCSEEGIPSGNPTSTSFYIDWVKLTQDVTSDTGKTTLVFSAEDADRDATIALYYSLDKYGPKTLIADGIPLSQRSYIWDTTSVPNGRYYIHVQARDPFNTNTTIAKGRVVVDNSSLTTRAAPELSIEAPASGTRSCDGVQVKGWTLLPDKRERIPLVQVLIDGVINSYPEALLYNPAAVAKYPPSTTESSNSGFDMLIDTSSLSPGPHSLEVRSLSPDGLVASSGPIPFEKTTTNCSPLITDPAPSGAPNTSIPDTSPVEPTAAPTPPPVAAPPVIQKARISSKGDLSLSIAETSNNASSSCTISLDLQSQTSNGFKTIKTFRTNRSTLVLKAPRLTVKKRALSSLMVRAQKSCPRQAPLYSAAVPLRVPIKGNITSFSQLKRHLSRSLKQKL